MLTYFSRSKILVNPTINKNFENKSFYSLIGCSIVLEFNLIVDTKDTKEIFAKIVFEIISKVLKFEFSAFFCKKKVFDTEISRLKVENDLKIFSNKVEKQS